MRRSVLIIALPVALTVGFLGPGPVTASATGSVARRYHVTQLASPGSATGGRSDAYGVNRRGQVAGSVTSADGVERAAVWNRRGTATLLGTFGGIASVAHDINRRGVVVGAADAADGSSYAFSWDPATRRMTNLGTLGGRFSAAWAVNDSGVVVGYADTAEGLRHAFRFDPPHRKMEDLGTLGGDGSAAWGINNRGEIVGEASTAQHLTHAVRWAPPTGGPSDLGVLPGTIVSFAQDINDRGEVVGWSEDAGDDSRQAFRWSPLTRTMTTLKGLRPGSNWARGIGPDGTVVGVVSVNGGARAFAWRRKTGEITLPVLYAGGRAEAADVNRRGDVVGIADTAAGRWSAVRWTSHRH